MPLVSRRPCCRLSSTRLASSAGRRRCQGRRKRRAALGPPEDARPEAEETSDICLASGEDEHPTPPERRRRRTETTSEDSTCLSPSPTDPEPIRRPRHRAEALALIYESKARRHRRDLAAAGAETLYPAQAPPLRGKRGGGVGRPSGAGPRPRPGRPPSAGGGDRGVPGCRAGPQAWRDGRPYVPAPPRAP